MKGLKNFSEASQLYTVDAIRMHYEICEHQWANINRLKSQIETQLFDKNGNPTGHARKKDVLQLLSSAWLLIDTISKIGKLANFVKGLSHRDDRYINFSEKLKKVKEFRDLYQHLDNELKSIGNGSSPIMGLFSFVRSNQTTSITIAFGMIAAQGSIHGLTVDTYEKKYVTDMQFSAGNKDIDLTGLIQSLLKFIEYFELWLIEQDHLLENEIEPSVLIFDIRALQNT